MSASLLRIPHDLSKFDLRGDELVIVTCWVCMNTDARYYSSGTSKRTSSTTTATKSSARSLRKIFSGFPRTYGTMLAIGFGDLLAGLLDPGTSDKFRK